MQPYFFPYIGFFQLVYASDKFIFLDDVNYIKGGWVNRNRIMVNGRENYINLNLKEASPFRVINTILIHDNRPKLLKTIEMAYKKAPYFNDAWPVIESVMKYEAATASELIIHGVKEVCKYLDITREFEVSSETYAHTKGLGKAERIIAICEMNNANHYINAIGGTAIYDKEFFLQHGVVLNFLETELVEYQNGADCFVPGLSIIDVMMWNSKEQIQEYMTKYTLV